MAYNKAKEEMKWKAWKEKEEKTLREFGMEERYILELRRRDWEDFNAERRFREHQTPFPEYEDTQYADMPEPELNGIEEMLSIIENEALLNTLLEADHKTLQILLLKIMGFSVKEIATKAGMPEQTVYTKMNRLRKKVKKIFESE